MPTTSRYMSSTKNVEAILNKITEGVAPPKFTVDHLKSIGFTSSNDRGIIPILKDLKFLSSDGTPLPRYHQYRDKSQSKAVMAEALREAYEDVFHINERPSTTDRAAIEGLLKSKHNSNERTAQLQAMTFFALLKLADLDAGHTTPPIPPLIQRPPTPDDDEGHPEEESSSQNKRTLSTELHYTIQVHLPATKEIEVFNAIFRSLRENLLS